MTDLTGAPQAAAQESAAGRQRSGHGSSAAGESSAVRGESSSVRGGSSAVRGGSSAVRGESSAVRGGSSAVRGGSDARPSSAGRAAYLAGARAVAPIAIAVVLFGASFGVLARDAGMGIVPPILMSLTTFAGSAQFAAASVLESGGALAAAIAAAVLLNLRYLAIGISVSPVLRGSAPRRLVEAQLAIDESWAVAQRGGRIDRGLLLGAGAVLVVAWTGGTVAGVLAGSALGDPADFGLDAMFPALFLALLVGQLDGRRARAAALIGGLVALALTPVVPPGLPIVAAALGAVFAVTVREVRP